MAKLKIYTFPDHVLAIKAASIPRVEKSFYQLADDMLETMYDAPGIGLAANQVGVLQRIIVLDTEYDLEKIAEDSEGVAGVEVVGGNIIKNKKPQILINPEIIYREGKILFNEACLSVPEYSAEVKRAEKIKLKYQDLDGLSHTLSADGLLAVAIQHEIDHLDGRLFIDRLSPLKKEMVKKRLKQERHDRETSHPAEKESESNKKKAKGF